MGKIQVKKVIRKFKLLKDTPVRKSGTIFTKGFESCSSGKIQNDTILYTGYKKGYKGTDMFNTFKIEEIDNFEEWFEKI